MGSSLAALQAECDVLRRSAGEKDSELSTLRQQGQIQQSSLDMERDRNNRELEALRAQLQQQVQSGHSITNTDEIFTMRHKSINTSQYNSDISEFISACMFAWCFLSIDSHQCRAEIRD